MRRSPRLSRPPCGPVRRRTRKSCPATSCILRDIDPSIIQDIRYAGSNNFVGRPLAGYGAGECVVKRAGRADAEKRTGGTGAPGAVAENARLLPAGAGGRRHGGVVAKTATRRRRSGVTIRRSASRICFVSAISPNAPAIPPGLPSISRWSICKADNSATFDPAKAYADCTANVNLRAPGRQRRHGHRL